MVDNLWLETELVTSKADADKKSAEGEHKTWRKFSLRGVQLRACVHAIISLSLATPKLPRPSQIPKATWK
jgi:hypothetical protein